MQQKAILLESVVILVVRAEFLIRSDFPRRLVFGHYGV
jgi:hypothetical protein